MMGVLLHLQQTPHQEVAVPEQLVELVVRVVQRLVLAVLA
jgi:hypothetical protein